MKKLLNILGAISLTATGASSVIACKQPHKVQNLNEFFKTASDRNLGEITISADSGIPMKKELFNGIKAKKNINALTENDFIIKGTPTTTSATIVGRGNFTGEVVLTYTKKPKTEMSTIVVVKELGEINFDNEIPIKKELLDGIKEKNKSSAADLSVDDFDISGTATATSTTIVGRGNLTGEVVLNYTKKPKTEMSNIVVVKELGEINFDNEAPIKRELLAGIKEKNKSSAADLSVDDFDISGTATATSTTIVGRGNLTGEVVLNYTKK